MKIQTSQHSHLQQKITPLKLNSMHHALRTQQPQLPSTDKNQYTNHIKTAFSDDSVKLRVFHEIDIHPTTINFIFLNKEQSRLYVSREKSTQVYQLSSQNIEKKNVYMEHIGRLPWSKYCLKIDQVLLLFCPFELRIRNNQKWYVHSFTTQLLNIRVNHESKSITSFHEQETIQWRIDEDQVDFSHVKKNQVPYHITKEGNIQGYGKKLNNSRLDKNSSNFTCCEFKEKDYLAIGDDNGALHIYDFKTLGHLKTIKKHLGAILSIKINRLNDTIFFTGSDSRICCVKRINNDEWILSEQVRGQSHDITSLQLYENFLLSGGLSTDICFYKLNQQSGCLQGTFQNRISYSNQQSIITQMQGYILVNKITSFQIWKCDQSTKDLVFIVRYKMPEMKFIKCLKMSKKLIDKTHLIVVSTEIDTVGWKFNQIEGLIKTFTIKNSYEHIQFIPGKNIFIGLRDNNVLEKVFCKTGKIDQLFEVDVELPTEMKILSQSHVLIGSKLTNHIKIFNSKKREVIFEKFLQSTYSLVCQLDIQSVLIKYFGSKILYSLPYINNPSCQESELINLPTSKIRFAGVIYHRSQKTRKSRRYWYFASQGKVYIINNLNHANKKKKIRVKATRRIGCLVKSTGNKNWILGVVCLNFSKMIDEMDIKPLFTKKII